MLPIDPYFPACVMRFGTVEGFRGHYLHYLTWPRPGASAHVIALVRASGSHLLFVLFVFLETADTTSARRCTAVLAVGAHHAFFQRVPRCILRSVRASVPLSGEPLFRVGLSHRDAAD